MTHHPSRACRFGRSRTIFAVVAASALLLGVATPSAGPARAASPEPPLAPVLPTLGASAARLAPAETDRVIVKLRADRATAQSAARTPAAVDGDVADRVGRLATRTGLRFRAMRGLAPELQVVQVEGVQSVGGLEAAVAALAADPAVEFAEPDRRMRAHLAPNDPRFNASATAQWYLKAVQATANGQTASAVNAEAAWDVTTGSTNVVIAVLDTGVRFEHPDLRRVADGGKLLPGYDFVNNVPTANDGDGWDADPSDPGDWVSQADRDAGGTFANCEVDPTSSWHGTRVAGIVAAATNNAEGIAGTAFNARVLPIRVLGKCGGFTSDIIAGMRWAAGLSVPNAPANPNPAKILNLSLGGDGTCSSAYQSAVDEILARDVLVIVSAGNDGSTVDAPANCRGVAAIGALRHVGNKVGFSNLGPGVAISAPGGNCVNVGAGQPCLFSIETTTNLGQTAPGASGYTDQLNFNVGTSFSAPIVAGIAGLVYAVQPTLTPAQAIARLRAAARPFPVVNEIDPVANQPIQQCRVPAGESDTQTVQCNCTRRTCGAGMADAGATLQQTSQPIAAIAVSGTPSPGLTVTLDGAASSAGRNAPLASYAWTAVGGGTLGSTTGVSSSIALPATGAVSARLVVTDTAGGSHTAVVPLTAVVPNVVGQPRAAAATALDAAELAVGTITTQTSATVPSGAVISQLPAAGGTVGAGTTVSLVLSSGAGTQPIAVPSVVGQTQAAATNTLTSAGFAVGTVTNEPSATVPSGSVISQTPAAGATAAPGSTVALVVSTGPAPAPPPPLPGGGGGGGGGGALDATTLGALLALGMLAGLGRRRRAARDR